MNKLTWLKGANTAANGVRNLFTVIEQLIHL